MKVPLLDLRPQHEALRGELLAAITAVLESQQFVLGPEVTKLELELAKHAQVAHAIGCASGSDALLLALMALDVNAGDEVITTPFTFFATGSAITRVGALPVFVDIDPDTYTIDPSQIEAVITPRTKALIPVHLYGQCADMDPLLAISERRKIPLIEDAAQAIGATDRGRRAGSMGLMGCFSFYPSKNLGGVGDGGMLTTNDESLAKRLRTLRIHGGATEYYHEEVGINSRLDSLQAAVLRVKLRHLDDWSEARRRKAARYREIFDEVKLDFELKLPFVRKEATHIYHQYVIRVPKHRDALMAHLTEHGVGTRVYYPVPLHRQHCFSFLGYRAGQFPESEAAAAETMALPCFPELTDEEQDYVVDTISKFHPKTA
ncbi:MAG TPA: DegT/DnrJ/EryC1/StrS family aminotransferase [Pyrinomonadaceae bacterium]|jgi:dTDP-4-amino-4,6-dideoxygalactose transaminase